MKFWKLYRKTIDKNCSVSYDHSDALSFWRTELFSTLLAYFVPLGILAALPGIAVSLLSNLPFLAFFDLLAAVAVAGIALCPRLGGRIRKWLFIGVLYAIAIILLCYLGAFGPGLIYLSAITTFTICILPQRYGWISVIANTIICITLGIIIALRLIPNAENPAFSLSGWLAVSINLVILNVIIASLLPRLFGGLQQTITQLHQAKEKAAFEQDNLSGLINNTSDVLYSVDTNMKLITANSIFKQSIFSITGKSIQSGDSLLMDDFSIEIRNGYKRNFERALSGETFNVTEHFELPEKLWTETSFSPIRTGEKIIGVACFARNITERVNAELAMKEAHKHLLFHLENSPLGYMEWDSQLRVTTMSKRTQEIMGWTQADIDSIELSGGSHIHVDDRQWVLPIAEQLLSGKIERNCVQNRVYTKTGKVIWCEWYNSIAKDEDGNVTTIMSLVKDITARKEAEDGIKELNENLEKRVTERTEELCEANKALEAFSYSVSHDLRAPLRVIEGVSSILTPSQGSNLNEQELEVIKVIKHNTKHMSEMIDNMLNFSRVNYVSVAKKKVNMSDMVKVVVEELKHTGTNFCGEIKLNNINSATCDSALMRQVWTNLISNAMKYSSKKQKPVIEIGCNGTNGHSVYYVKDNGAGFDMENAQKLFGVFQRLHASSEFEGTGVGLALSQRIVNKHGGKIWAEGYIGRGATFYFTLQ